VLFSSLLDKFWDLRQNKSKKKRQLEDGPDCTMGADFKESKRAIEGSATKQHAKSEKRLDIVGLLGHFVHIVMSLALFLCINM
jgi:hypothetical protein